MKLRAGELKDTVMEILNKRNVESADVIADHMVEAELRGHSSHGVQRLIPLVKGVELGTIRSKLEYKVLEETKTSKLIDAMGSVGMVIWNKLIQEKFEDPISIISTRNASHIGFLGYYTEKLARRGLVSIMFGNAEPAVVFPGSAKRVLSTTPISISIPYDPPIVLDMALSATSRGKIIEANRKGLKLEPGLAVDENGNYTLDPDKALKGGILPLGGVKGFYLMLLLELVTSFLSGCAVGPDVRGVLNTENPPNKGEVLIVINPSYFAHNTESIIKLRTILNMELPGEHSQKIKKLKLVEGVNIDDELWTNLINLRDKVPYFTSN
ncbi:Ldh family oxidoreductase [Metallosphaera tengchongensis]|uniref:Ldh family oxidoreductase n=1 Tax=Metallosphaera tengchongensis TaxID=1532350 RepID=A0A6N0NVG2_9CREN|nr:Ldh family oxidoreductase [Metallosphaera tengchongensis]QKR00195.1 Ldh family oxidoreductase [Metallosphaera tengchongensis]